MRKSRSFREKKPLFLVEKAVLSGRETAAVLEINGRIL